MAVVRKLIKARGKQNKSEKIKDENIADPISIPHNITKTWNKSSSTKNDRVTGIIDFIWRRFPLLKKNYIWIHTKNLYLSKNRNWRWSWRKEKIIKLCIITPTKNIDKTNKNRVGHSMWEWCNLIRRKMSLRQEWLVKLRNMSNTLKTNIWATTSKISRSI